MLLFLSRIKQDWKLLALAVAFRFFKMLSFAFQIDYGYDWLAAVLLLCPSTSCPVISDSKHKK